MTTASRYRGGLPLLRWLHRHHPEAALVMAAHIRRQQPALSSTDHDDPDREIRPTVGEMMREASDAFRVFVRDGVRHIGKGYRRVSDKGYRADEWQYLGNLSFYRGALREWGFTSRGKKLKPRDDIRGNGKNKRNPARYLDTKPTPPAPFDRSGLERTPCLPPPDDGKPSPYYDPLPPMEPTKDDKAGRYGVERARAELEALMADYSGPITKCPTVTAKNAHFFGGIIRPKSGTKKGAMGAWDAPEVTKGEAAEVIEEVLSGGNLKSLGVRLGYGPEYADRVAKVALLETAKVLEASNDNNKAKKVAA